MLCCAAQPKVAKKSQPPAAGKKPEGAKKAKKSPLFVKRVKNFGIGNDLPPKRDLSRLVRWPRYVRIQRQRAVLMKRLKVPPAINQFRNTADNNSSRTLFRLLNKYRPETRAAKKARLLAKAKGENAGDDAKPLVVKYGLNHVVSLVEQKKAKLVVIAHDVDPIELVVYLPALCRKVDVPYMIVKGKARLGEVVHKKTSAVLAVTDVGKEDQGELATLVSYARENYNDNAPARRQWGGGKLGHKSAMAQAKLQKAIRREEARKQKIALV